MPQNDHPMKFLPERIPIKFWVIQFLLFFRVYSVCKSMFFRTRLLKLLINCVRYTLICTIILDKRPNECKGLYCMSGKGAPELYSYTNTEENIYNWRRKCVYVVHVFFSPYKYLNVMDPFWKSAVSREPCYLKIYITVLRPSFGSAERMYSARKTFVNAYFR